PAPTTDLCGPRSPARASARFLSCGVLPHFHHGCHAHGFAWAWLDDVLSGYHAHAKPCPTLRLESRLTDDYTSPTPLPPGRKRRTDRHRDCAHANDGWR